MKKEDEKIKCRIAGCVAIAEVFDLSLKSGRQIHTSYCDYHAWLERTYDEEFLFAVIIRRGVAIFENNHLFVYIPEGLIIEDRRPLSKAIREMFRDRTNGD